MECFITGTKLPKEKIEIYNFLPDQENDLSFNCEQKISIFNQFKKIYENQGNIIEANYFNSLAMENQKKLLELNIKKDSKGFFSESSFELLSLKLNKWSNNHGESWRRALIFSLTTSFLLYCLYYLSIHFKDYFSLQKIDDFVGNYFSFLNITRKEDFMINSERITAVTKLIDFISRIMIGYGFYQLVAAFRRHGRKI